MEATAEKTAAVRNVPALRFPEFEGEWEKKSIGCIATKVGSGSTPSGGEKVYLNTGIPFIRSQNVNDNQLILDNVSFISEEINNKMKGSAVLGNDVLLNITGGSIGRSCVVPADFKVGNVNQHVCIIRLNENNVPAFLQAYLSSYNGQKALERSQVGSGREGLNFQSIRSLKVVLPTLVEQQKIASFLTAAEDKIQQLRKKKELLEKYKKGVMQQIFSQQIRFEDDNGNDFPEWEEKMIKDIAPLQRGFDLPVSEIKEGEFPVVFSNGILKSHSEYKAKGPGVVTGRSGTIGQVTFVEKDYWPHNTSLWVTNFCGNDPKYVFYFYEQFKLERFGTGSGVPTLNRNDVHVQKVYFPTYPEQVKIRGFITVLDNKINYTYKQLEQAQQFKKGLLQQLFV